MSIQPQQPQIDNNIKIYSSDFLSEAQNTAVNANTPAIILAAAGVVKTTTLTHRINKAYSVDNLALDSIFATAFTRKASAEMRGRTQKLIGDAPEFMGTFHRNSLLLAKKYPILLQAHGYDSMIEMIDAKDSDALLAQLLKPYDKHLKHLSISKKNAKKWIREGNDSLKGRGLYPIDYYCAPAPIDAHNILKLTDKFEQLPAEIAYEVYRGYQEALQRMNLLDFNDVMALPVFAMRDENIRAFSMHSSNW